LPQSNPAPAPSPPPGGLTIRGKQVKPGPAPLSAAPQEEIKAQSGAAPPPAAATEKAGSEARAAGPRTLMRESAGAVRTCGAVHDPSGRPIASAQVAIADLGLTATTDASGRWCLDLPPGDRSLAVMAVG